MELNTLQKIRWFKGAISIFDKDPELYSRFNAAWPLYGLRWSLILLNEFIQDGWQRRVYANRNIKHHQEKKIAGQIIKAKSLCEQIQLANLKCSYV